MASSFQQNSRTDLTDVSGLVAVVTGGGTGLGLIIARALEANGAKVFITGRRQERLDEATKLAVSFLT
jgi:NADP-dependent 3-hydroxy acid dehydrogenase YdfG